MHGNAASELDLYLRVFAITIAAMARPCRCERWPSRPRSSRATSACCRIPHGAALDPHGMAVEALVEAVLAGLARSRYAAGHFSACAPTMLPKPCSAATGGALSRPWRDRFDLACGALFARPATMPSRVDARDGAGPTCHRATTAATCVIEGRAGATRIGPHPDVTPLAAEPRGSSARRRACLAVCPTATSTPGGCVLEGSIKEMIEAASRRVLDVT